MHVLNPKVLQKINNDPVLCSICVATYNRLSLLEKLLNSLKSQILPDHVSLEIIVVDNDPNQSAKPVVAKFHTTNRIQFHYFNQQQKNISLTRNLAIKKASGKYIFFIDDDEWASSNWISVLLNTLQLYDSDGAFGMVIPQFDTEFPKLFRKSEYYYSPVTDTGTKTRFYLGGNCIIKASLLKNLEEPFDKSYGISGGEDVHLFERLDKKGAYFINSREAIVYEYLPIECASYHFIFVRAFKGGNSYSRRRIEFANNLKLLVRIEMFIKGILVILISMFLFTILFFKSEMRIFWLIKLGANCGKVMSVFGWIYKAYK